MTFLVDTDWLLNAYADRGAALDVLEALSDRGLAVSVLSLGEAYAGIVRQPNESANLAFFDRFVRRYEIIGLSSSVMLTFARIQYELESRGRPLDSIDLLIAATALDEDPVLITRNRRHYERVPGLRIY